MLTAMPTDILRFIFFPPLSDQQHHNHAAQHGKLSLIHIFNHHHQHIAQEHAHDAQHSVEDDQMCIRDRYGPCNYKAVNWETSEEAYTTEQYDEFAAAFDAATQA